MPDPYERHSRPGSIYDYYSAQPPRSQQRRMAAGEPAAKRPPGRKDRDLCKAAHWKGPHQPQLRKHGYGLRQDPVCGWRISWRDASKLTWTCFHDEICAGCGKILRTSIPAAECPGYHPVTDDERTALYAERAENDARLAASRMRNRWQPRPPVTGPQGYRRPRPG